CNRSEIYIAAPEEKLEQQVEVVREQYEGLLEEAARDKYLYIKIGHDAVYHLYKVAAGLDSIILGEDQILGQVKDAHGFALELGSSKKVLNKFFREAATTAKKIKTELKISENPISISSIGVKFIKDKIGSYKCKNILIVGLGKMGRLALNYILEEEADKIYMANRNHQKVVDISREYPSVIPVDYKDRYEILEEADVLITATSSPHTIIKEEMIGRRAKELYIMDLALPRDVEEAVGKLPKVHLYNVDDLQAISGSNERLRSELSKKAEAVVNSDVEEFEGWLSAIQADTVIRSLKEKCSIIEKDTMEYIDKKLELDSRDKKLVEKMLSSALKRLIREPVLRLKEIEDSEKRALYMKVVEDLFDMELD
ncbi:MAG: glutamyl-tRNA reductase, partial [Bacillota bacterium]|nr:glutamyl-tRNA reductase [Bacillota bacterium]